MILEFNEKTPFDPALLADHLPNEIATRPFNYTRAGKAAAKKVQNREVTIAEFLARILDHVEGPKDGAAFIPGKIIGSVRTANAVSEVHAVGLDIDNGTPIEEIKDAIERCGLCAALYTTHSHLKDKTEINCVQLHKYRDKNCPDTSLEEASVKYLREVKHYHSSVLETCEFVDREVTSHGESYIVSHDAMHKVRVVIFLTEPFDIIAAAPTQPEAHAKWKAVLRGVAELLDLQIDEACLDPARLFYFPRHPCGGSFYTWCNTEGHLLDLKTIVPVDPPEKTDHRRDRSTKESLPAWLKKWAATTAPRFLMATMFRDNAPDHVRNDRSEGKMTVECPFDGEHTDAGNPNDQGCFVRDAEDDPVHPSFTFVCSHNACSGRDRLDMIAEAIEQGWFEKECLFDEKYQILNEGAGDVDAAKWEQAAQRGDIFDEDFGFKMPFGFVALEMGNSFGFFKSNGAEGEEPTPVCQSFRVVGAASDLTGGSATILISFVDMQNKYKEISYNRSELASRSKDVSARFEDQWFCVYDRFAFGDLLGRIVSESTITLIPRTGWHGAHFLTVGGETIGPEGVVLRLKSGSTLTAVKEGTLKGWIDAVAPIFEDDAKGWEHLALGVLAGGAGPVASFLSDTGMPILAFHGLSSRGKSTALRLAASAGAAPNDKGAFSTLRATDNGVEGTLASRSGITVSFDEGQHADVNALRKLVWMIAEGSGKQRADERGNARPVSSFSGYALFSNEIALTDLIRQGGGSVPQGMHNRMCDVNISDVLDLDPESVKRVISGPRAGVEAHYGHVVPLLAARLAEKSREEVQGEVDGWVEKIIEGENVADTQRRPAMVLAVVGYAGTLMQEACLIPADIDILRVLKWAWVRRPVAAMSDPVEAALDRLADRINALRGVEIFETDQIDERRFKEAKGWFHRSDVHGAYCALYPDALVEMAGGTIPRAVIVRALSDRNLLIPCGSKNKLHRKVGGKVFSNYRIRSSFYEEASERGE